MRSFQSFFFTSWQENDRKGYMISNSDKLGEKFQEGTSVKIIGLNDCPQQALHSIGKVVINPYNRVPNRITVRLRLDVCYRAYLEEPGWSWSCEGVFRDSDLEIIYE